MRAQQEVHQTLLGNSTAQATIVSLMKTKLQNLMKETSLKITFSKDQVYLVQKEAWVLKAANRLKTSRLNQTLTAIILTR